MKILVYGSGGREHAILKSLASSPTLPEIFVYPGNPGMKEAKIVSLPITKSKSEEFEQLAVYCKTEKITFVFVGPEEPLCLGLSDILRKNDIAVVGPDSAAARLEGSKIFSKNFMLKYKIPTARSVVASSVSQVVENLSSFSIPYVLKADGLAAGKGVVVSDSPDDIISAARDFVENGKLGDAGKTLLIEEGLKGWEISVLVLTNGTDYQVLPLAQDHKRLNDNAKGPNTGGMGTIAPMELPSDLSKQIEQEIVAPTIKGLNSEKWVYRGIIFIGIMVTERGPKVLEYNVRLGDPETQVILPLIKNDTAKLFHQLALGKLEKLEIKNQHACCVILAAPGYPDAPEKGVRIEGDLLTSFQAVDTQSYFVHAGTKLDNGTWVTNGGRVLGSVGIASTREQAIGAAYDQTKKAKWNGLQMRNDIGKELPVPT
ncbi:MAG: phosphoribosylamine--glycine ligase [Bdellovibrionota bacterium]